jgi:hypothetical protein
MKAAEKRYSRSYKTTDKVYKKAMRRAKKEKSTLANAIEYFVELYADGMYFKSSPFKTEE